MNKSSLAVLVGLAFSSQSALADDFVNELFKNNAGVLSGVQDNGGEPCSLVVSQLDNGAFSAQFNFFDQVSKTTKQVAFEDSKFFYQGELPFVQAVTGFLFGEVKYGIAFDADYRINRFWVANWNREFAFCRMN